MIRLRYSVPEDLEFILASEGDAAHTPYIGSWTRAQHCRAIQQGDYNHFIIQNGDDLVGYAILKGMDSADKCIELYRIVVNEKGRGFGRAAIALIQQLCFGERGAHRLFLDVVEDNARAIHLYTAMGFKHEGTLRECMKYPEGYKSLHLMGMLETEYHPENTSQPH